MARHAGNRAENFLQGTAQASRASAFGMFDSDVECKALQICREHAARPPGRGNASVHGPGGTHGGTAGRPAGGRPAGPPCTDRVRGVRSRSVRGLGPAGAPSSPPLQPLPPPAGRPTPQPGRSDPSPAAGRTGSPGPVESVPRTCRKRLSTQRRARRVCVGRVPPSPERPGDGGGGGARSRRRSRSTWGFAPRDGVSIPAAVLDQRESEGYPTERADSCIQSDSDWW